jgi:hypothetical protein
VLFVLPTVLRVCNSRCDAKAKKRNEKKKKKEKINGDGSVMCVFGTMENNERTRETGRGGERDRRQCEKLQVTERRIGR